MGRQQAGGPAKGVQGGVGSWTLPEEQQLPSLVPYSLWCNLPPMTLLGRSLNKVLKTNDSIFRLANVWNDLEKIFIVVFSILQVWSLRFQLQFSECVGGSSADEVTLLSERPLALRSPPHCPEDPASPEGSPQLLPAASSHCRLGSQERETRVDAIGKQPFYIQLPLPF